MPASPKPAGWPFSLGVLLGRRILTVMDRQRSTVAVAALAVVAVIFVVLALHRGSTLTKATAAAPPSFPPAVSASSVPVVASASLSASGNPGAATATASSSVPAGPVVAFLGDGYTGGDGGTSHALRWTTLVAADFGWTERNFAFGGTGYSTGGKQPGGIPYTARIAGLVATAPSIVIVSGGRYDIQSTNGPTQIKAGVTATFTALRAALPNAVIIAENPLWSSSKLPATLALVTADVKAAVAAVGGRYLDIGQPLVGAPADLASNPALPNDAGYAALAKAFETAYSS
jgi:acyl-CoA thioesterase-1